MADDGSILVTGAAGQLGAVGRTVTGLLLEGGLPVRAMVRRDDDRAAALRAAGAEVVLESTPRVLAPLPTDGPAVLAVLPLERDASGAWEIPAALSEQSA